jgi:hypothetical protein
MTGLLRILALVALTGLAGCGGGLNLNPFTWFGDGEDEVRRLEAVDLGASAETRPLVVQVTSLVVERVPGGIIVRATGLPPTQGYFDAGLTLEGPVDGGVLPLAFRASPPPEPQAVSTVASREIVVGYYLADRELDGATRISVRGGRNALVARR